MMSRPSITVDLRCLGLILTAELLRGYIDHHCTVPQCQGPCISDHVALTVIIVYILSIETGQYALKTNYL